MNWKEIKEKYPDALKASINWYMDNPIKSSDFIEMVEYIKEGDYLGSVYYRELFDFFDEQKIWITIVHDEDYEHVHPPHWNALVHYEPTKEEYKEEIDIDNIIYSDYSYDEDDPRFKDNDNLNATSRNEAESWAIIKAFEILQKEIKS